MYQYEEIIKAHLKDKYTEHGEELRCSCPFGTHEDKHPSFNINMESGLYYCFSCEAHGNIFDFIAKVEGTTYQEVWKRLTGGGDTPLDDYSANKELPIDFLKNLGLYSSGTKVAMPYFDENHNKLATRYRHHPKDTFRFSWNKGNNMNLYGLWQLKKFSDDYIVISEGESDTQTLWYYDVPAVGVPSGEGAKSAIKDKSIFDRFEKIYVHSDGDRTGNDFVKSVAKILYPKEVYKISVSSLNLGAKDPSDLHIMGVFSLDRLLATQELVEVSEEELEAENTKNSGTEELYETAEFLVNECHVRYYKENFYIYQNGVYIQSARKVERLMYDRNKLLKKGKRNEVLEYIKLIGYVEETTDMDNYINFRNGIYDITARKLIPHSPDLFILNQINTNYSENPVENQDIINFLNDITCGDELKEKTILQIGGYVMTTSVKLQKSFIFYGKTAENGKSTLIYLFEFLIGEENTCHVTIHQLQERFYASELVNKLLNVVSELPRNHLKSVEIFKSIVTGDKMAVEQKYKDRFNIRPYAKSIFTANELPRVDDTTDGYYRRLQIIEFTAKFTDEQKKNFDKRKLVTPNALEYFANICLRAYLELLNSDTQNFANEEESQRLLEIYKQENNSVLSFISSEKVKEMFQNNSRIATTELYSQYKTWCQENGYKIKGRNKFLSEVKEVEWIEKKVYDGCEKFTRRKHLEDGTF